MAGLISNKNTMDTVKILWLYLGNLHEIWEESRSKGCKKKGLAKGSRKSCKYNVNKIAPNYPQASKLEEMDFCLVIKTTPNHCPSCYALLRFYLLKSKKDNQPEENGDALIRTKFHRKFKDREQEEKKGWRNLQEAILSYFFISC